MAVKIKKNVHNPAPLKPRFNTNFMERKKVNNVLGLGKEQRWKKIVDSNLYTIT
jgi:hypothetical protein